MGDQLDLFRSEQWGPEAATPGRATARQARPASEQQPLRGRPRKRGVTPAWVAFTPLIGVSQFGWLHGDGGSPRLCETRRFLGRVGAERATLIALEDGSTFFDVADGELRWEPREAEDACAFVDMPPPEVERYESGARRLDLHHVERHRNALWNLLVGAARGLGLPCGHGLRAAAAGRVVPAGLGLVDEDPEVFAAAICERVGEGEDPLAALWAELADDADQGEDAEVDAVLWATGWSDVLLHLEQRVHALVEAGW